MKNLFLRAFLALNSLIILQACDDLSSPSQIAPAYLNIDTIEYVNGTHAFNGHRITDVWIYVNSKYIGAFELPAYNIPIIPDGTNSTVWVQAGIYTDGIKTQRVTYPYYTRHEEKRTFESGQSVKIKPKFEFLPNKILFEENFESSADTLMVKSYLNRASFTRGTDSNLPQENGSYYALLQTPKDTLKQIELISKNYYDLPSAFRPTYFEMSYKSSLAFSVGIYVYPIGATAYSMYDLVLLPSSEWKRVYVYLGEEMFPSTYQHPSNSKFKVAIRANSDGKQANNLAIDNLRLVY